MNLITNITFIERLKLIRLINNKTQREMALLLDVGYGTYTRWEQDPKNYKIKRIQQKGITQTLYESNWDTIITQEKVLNIALDALSTNAIYRPKLNEGLQNRKREKNK